MINPGKAVIESTAPPHISLGGMKLVSAVLFGLTFGFLLQKGGAGKYNILLGQLLLQDFTVAKIMITAILVGMVGVFTLHHFAKANLQIKPTRLGAQIIGGLLFGIGFALIAYCPGTGAVALGQGSWDVLFGIAGLIAGSYLFAEMSGWLKRTVEKWGDEGKLMLPDLLRIPRGVFVPLFALLLIGLLYAMERLAPRRASGTNTASSMTLHTAFPRCLVAAILLLVPAAAPACPLCDSATGQQVRAGIFDNDFWSTLLVVISPFPVLLLALAAYHFGWPRFGKQSNPDTDTNANTNTPIS